jgi:hypothetical protein
MTVRQRVLAAYGAKCAWCQTTTGPFEIDHVHGGGNQHRRALAGEKLERWLWRQYQQSGSYPSGFEILCKPCHDRKSGRMPAAKDKASVRFSLPEGVLQAAQKARPDLKTQSAVVEIALRKLAEGAQAGAAVDLTDVHQHLAQVGTDLLQAVQDLRQDVREAGRQDALRFAALETRLEQTDRRLHDLTLAYDRLSGRTPSPTRPWWKALFFPPT